MVHLKLWLCSLPGGEGGLAPDPTKETVIQSPPFTILITDLKGLSHEIDFKNVDENGQILALLRAAAGF